MKKRVLALSLACAMVMGIAANVAAAEEVVVKIGYENTDTEPIGLAMQEWKRLIEEKGDGTLKVELFPNSSLGKKAELIDMMLLGEPVVTIADGAFYADYGVKDMGIMYGPFFFETWDDVWTLVDSEWYAEQSKLLEEKGLKLLASNWIYGDRHLMTKNPVTVPSDLEGVKLRVASSEIYMEGWNALGATATGIALGETYQALQTGVVEGVENPLSVLYAQSFQEVTPNLLLTGHIRNFTTWVTGTDFFNGLSEEHQELLVATAEEAGLFNNELAMKADEEYAQKLIDAGVTITELTDETRPLWEEAAKGFYDKAEQFGWSEGLYERTQEAMGK